MTMYTGVGWGRCSEGLRHTRVVDDWEGSYFGDILLAFALLHYPQ